MQKEPDLIVEEDSLCFFMDTSPAVNYKEVMEEFCNVMVLVLNQTWQCPMGEPSHWFWWCHNSLVDILWGVTAVLVGSINTIPTVLHCTNTVDSDFQFQKINSILGKITKLYTKLPESIPPNTGTTNE